MDYSASNAFVSAQKKTCLPAKVQKTIFRSGYTNNNSNSNNILSSSSLSFVVLVLKNTFFWALYIKKGIFWVWGRRDHEKEFNGKWKTFCVYEKREKKNSFSTFTLLCKGFFLCFVRGSFIYDVTYIWHFIKFKAEAREALKLIFSDWRHFQLTPIMYDVKNRRLSVWTSFIITKNVVQRVDGKES